MTFLVTSFSPICLQSVERACRIIRLQDNCPQEKFCNCSHNKTTWTWLFYPRALSFSIRYNAVTPLALRVDTQDENLLFAENCGRSSLNTGHHFCPLLTLTWLANSHALVCVLSLAYFYICKKKKKAITDASLHFNCTVTGTMKHLAELEAELLSFFEKLSFFNISFSWSLYCSSV